MNIPGGGTVVSDLDSVLTWDDSPIACLPATKHCFWLLPNYSVNQTNSLCLLGGQQTHAGECGNRLLAVHYQD